MAKILLKQRLDFPLEKRIKATDSIPAIEDHKNIETTVRFSFEKQLKRRKDCLQSKVKKLLKRRIDCLQCKAKKLVKQ